MKCQKPRFCLLDLTEGSRVQNLQLHCQKCVPMLLSFSHIIIFSNNRRQLLKNIA